MKNRIAIFIENLRENFWLLPLFMVILAIALAFALVYLDRQVDSERIPTVRWFYSGGAEGARDLLSTVASAMMTVAGVTFSITIVALSIASSQFGPRLLRNFMRDTGNQLTLGTFISTFIYCLMVLRTIRSADEVYFVPYISVSAAIFLATLSLIILIYFIHHVSSSINADNVISLIKGDIDRAIEKLYPEPESRQQFAEEDSDTFELPEEPGISIRSQASGYVQGVDYDLLHNIAQSEDLVMNVLVRAGQFIDRDSEMITVWTDELSDVDQEGIRASILIGTRRARTQDVEYEIHQLVEIAVRALSPSLNDPFTAVAAIDQLGAAISRMAERDIPTAYRRNGDGKLRLVLNTVTFRGIVDTAFNQIRQYGKDSVSVSIRLLETLTVIANHTMDPHKHEALKRQGDMIWSSSQAAIQVRSDLEDIRSRYLSLLKATGTD